MQIIRPYGSSRSKKSGDGLRRVLVEKTTGRPEHDIPAFASSHDELVIAQWISTIDKIARKPMGRKKPSAAQRAFRHKLGNACWLRLIEGRHLAGAGGENRPFLNDLWWFKIHPYGEGTEEPRSRRDGSGPSAPKITGRWYEVFAGVDAPERADANKIAEIAARIEKHLYENEYRLGRDVQNRSTGKINARAESISTNTLRAPAPPDARKGNAEWTEGDIAAYTRPRDPAQAIHKEAGALEKKKGRTRLPVAAQILFDHWGEIFRNPESGALMNVKDASEKLPGMFALHMQLKRCYSRLLKRTRKDTPDHRKRDRNGRRLSTLLPRNLHEALNLSKRQDTNADLGHLVRLGKIIHYAASDGRADHPKAIKDNWPENIDGSRFWTSEGQAEIKRAEAFVRIWRHAFVLAGLTLKDWVSMKEPFRGDVLGGRNRLDKALEPSRFERGHFDRKVALLYGNRAGSFILDADIDCSNLLRGLIEGAANLRHAVFHFKGRGQLLDELAELPRRFSTPVREAAQRLWQADAADRTSRLKATLRGAHVEHLLTSDQAAQVLGLLTEDVPAELALPRLSRILNRAENAWDKDKNIKLPKPANRRALEVPARLCQYTLLKLIYERHFKSWLKSREAEVLSAWIDRAVSRTTDAAKAINAKGDEVGRKVIVARAAELPKPSAGGDITDFFFELSAATASEMRVQRGYESDGEKAREQAEYIDHLLCDVVILSFSQYLAEQKLDWALELKPDQAPSVNPTFSLDELQTPEATLNAEDWQAALYLILHLLPVEPVGRLLHQLFKWDITARRDTKPTPEEETRLQRLFATMTLYLDMHDAKFEGGNALVGCKEFAVLFESEQTFERVFSQALSQETDRRIPRRGLREIMRFGHMPLLKAINASRQIDDATVERVFRLEAPQDDGRSQIATLQQRREELHDKWVYKKKHLEAADLQAYCEAVAAISEHRRDSAIVNLVDHVRSHRLIMAVLGRLVDYVGLFERDLYFVTLALLYRKGLRPNYLFAEKGLDSLLNGQIIFALRDAKNDSPLAVEILNELAGHFSEVWAERSPMANIRNNLAHLNMLQGATPAPRLTHWVNQTRQLMGYDRKLKNAVSKSLIELLAREGIDIRWDINVNGYAHDLTNAKLSSRYAIHLGGMRLTLADNGEEPKEVLLRETLLSDGCVAMIAAAFDGKMQQTTSIAENLSKVNWQASA
jgi:hypothetical protein